MRIDRSGKHIGSKMGNITINAALVSVLVGSLLPLLVGLVTKIELHSGIKAAILLLFSVVQGVIVTAIQTDGSAIISTEALLTAAITWISGVASYNGLLKPAEVSTKLNEKTANFGLGRRSV